jgi:hypothetical protein
MKYPIDAICNVTETQRDDDNRKQTRTIRRTKNIVYPPIYCVTKRVKLRVI